MNRAALRRSLRNRVPFFGLVTSIWIVPTVAIAQAPDAAASNEVTVEQIMDAWSARHERVHSARFKFTEERVLLPGTQSGRGNRWRDDEGNLFPAEALTLVREHEVVFDGILARHDSDGDNWHPMAEGPVRRHVVELSDGKREVLYHGYEEPTDDIYPQAYIHPAEGERAGVFFGQLAGVFPIFITFRAPHPAFARPNSTGPFNASTYRLLDREGTIDGRRCLILENARLADEFGAAYRIWVDPNRDFIVVRTESGPRGLVLGQVDVDYERDESGLWVPMRWRHLFHARHEDGGRRLRETATYTVTEYALNPRIDESLFDFQPPSGTMEEDDTSGDRETLLTREEGVRPVTEGELMRGARYSDLLQTDSGEALLPPGRTSWRWTWLALAVVLAGFGWLVWRRR